MDAVALADALVRGAAAGLGTLIALVFVRGSTGARSRRLGALFSFATATYVLVSSDAIFNSFRPYALAVTPIAVLGTVVFWWFAASIFDDRFRWTWWRIAPAPLLLALYLSGSLQSPPFVETLRFNGHIILNIAMFADVLRLVAVSAAEDLSDPRRRFRVAIGVVVAVFGIAIGVAEFLEAGVELPRSVLFVQGTAILVLNLVFGLWLLSARDELFLTEAEAVRRIEVRGAPESPAPPADRPAFERLNALMDEGVYRGEGLSVGVLAGKVGVPEHQLRRLINQELGYRNFSSFLHARRIADARVMLADRANARRQILQVALDLGYGSIAPFNRAFKEATGVTPTAFRRAALDENAPGPDPNGRPDAERD